MRKGNIGLRWGAINQKYELVKYWGDSEHHHVVAFFEKHKEGYDLRTIGERFFEDHDAWVVGKHALAFLNAIYQEEKE